MMGEFLGELLQELIFRPLFGALLSAVLLVGHLLFYPLLLFGGWLRLWLQERGHNSFRGLWRAHGPAGLHRAGWQQTVWATQSFIAALLIALGVAGVGAMLYAIGKSTGL